MRLIAKISQNRRDFVGHYECEHCKHVEDIRGYDDAYYHQSVIPTMVCGSCGEKGNGLEISVPDVPAGVHL
jgi:hypothetical protein